MADVIITPITNEDLTTKVVNGTGIFDELMTAANAHLDSQFKNERITGTQYAEVYLGQLQAVLSNAVQFLIERDKTYLSNLLINAQIDLATKEYQIEVDLLQSIPGIGKDSAISIISEIGVDMSKFPNETHLSSWAGMSPGNKETGGKKK